MGFPPPSVSYEAVVDFGETGLVGTLGVRVIDNVGNDTIARTTAGIIEDPAGSGIYQKTLTAPALEGQYSVVWDDADDHYAVDDLVVTSDAPITVVGAPAGDLGPCTNWLTDEDVAACCANIDASDPTIFDSALAQAQELLFQFSGRRFPGVCGPITVRPCRTGCGCAWQVLSRGHLVFNPLQNDGWWTCDNGDPCGCRPRSRVLLSGYVQEVTEVLIDGDTVDPDTYRVDQRKWLTRVRSDPDVALVWPGCQNLDLPESEEGTFAVTYTFGKNPPLSGVAAATELACEIYKSCNGDECALPKGVARLARQGVVIEKAPFTSWGFATGRNGTEKGWNTGMASVDAFLNAFNPTGLIKAPIFWSPASVGRYAQQVG